MNELKLQPLTCPQCGAPGVVRQGTRITECERCGVRLCLTQATTPRYEAVANLNALEAVNAARIWLESRGQVGVLGQPELVLVPFHEIAGRRVGIFERKVPERHRVHRTIYSPQSGGPDVESSWVYVEREDTKVMVSDFQQLVPAARTRWDLQAFDARAARKMATLRSFDLVEAQRRGTVYAEEQSPAATARRRFIERQFSEKGSAEVVATSRRTLFFPFWSIPVQTAAGSHEIVADGLSGTIVAWCLPEAYPGSSLSWAALAVLGALGLGQALNAALVGTAVIDPVFAFVVGVLATGAALWHANRPDWILRSWPQPDTLPRRTP
jgi:hypothetical protein